MKTQYQEKEDRAKYVPRPIRELIRLAQEYLTQEHKIYCIPFSYLKKPIEFPKDNKGKNLVYSLK